jgi:hypothetical protein
VERKVKRVLLSQQVRQSSTKISSGAIGKTAGGVCGQKSRQFSIIITIKKGDM